MHEITFLINHFFIFSADINFLRRLMPIHFAG